VFPPKLIEVRDGAAVFQEMHVDGGISAPFFSVPASVLFSTGPTRLFQRDQFYVIINGSLDASPQTTRMNTVAVIGRSVVALQLSTARDVLGETEVFCARNGVAFNAAALPSGAGPGDPLDFSAENRERLFRLGEHLGASGEAWNLAKPGG
jgi:hypothetical protein